MRILSCMILFGVSCVAVGGQLPLPGGGILDYAIQDGTGVSVTGAVDVCGCVAVPETVEGLPVTDIGPAAFKGCEGLSEIVLPVSVTNIGESAFRRCRNLRRISLPNGLESLRLGTFSECPSLNEINLPPNLKELGRGMRMVQRTEEVIVGGSSASRTVYTFALSDPLESADGVFFRCTGLIRVRIPATVGYVGDYAFAGCANLKELSFAGDEPDARGWGILRGTPKDLVVSVKSTALGWYDPIALGALSMWQGRAVLYDGQFVGLEKPDPTRVQARLNGVVDMLRTVGVSLTEERKQAYLRWGRDLVQTCPEALSDYAEFLTELGCSLTTEEATSLASWASSVASSAPAEGSASSPSDAPASEIVEAKLAVTNIVLHYVQEVDKMPMIDPLPADGFVAVVSEVKGSEAISIPSSWTNRYPQFAAQYGLDFAVALMKPTGKRGSNGAPLLVWQDFVAGTDPTDPSSTFTATIDFVEGHPVVTWSPKVEDAHAPRVYRVFGKKSLNDADWDELEATSLDGYNFFKVTVELASVSNAE